MPMLSTVVQLTAALSLGALSLGTFPMLALAQTPAPKLVSEKGRHALLVDGAPYLVLGAQIGNSSAWPEVLPKVWPALEAMHVNTAEAPVYWEQIEPKPGQFDWTTVDALIDGARAHHMHMVLLWFGTWKNGNDHYVPQWVKRDSEHFPRMINSAGTPIDDLSANSAANMEADRKAFVALTHHIAEKDGSQHTVLMMQVENESGGIGAARDYSASSNREFAGQVPTELVKGLGKKAGTWTQVFSGNADEAFQAWHMARYINAIAEAGKRELNIPFYCNVWLIYPPAALPERRIPDAGIGYPSGGPNQGMLSIWKIAAPAIDMIGPDIYASNVDFALDVMKTYNRPDNPLWIPEVGQGSDYAPFLFAAIGQGGIGFSPFGIDWTDHLPVGSVPHAHAANFALLGPMQRTIARLNYAGKVKTFIEVAGGTEQEKLFSSNEEAAEGAVKQPGSSGEGIALISPMRLANAMVPLDQVGTAETRSADATGAWVAEVRFGFPQRDGEPAPGSANKEGRMLVAQLGPDEYLVTGIGGAVFFHRPGLLTGIRMQILTAEEGYYTPGAGAGGADVWHTIRVLNGDEMDRGIHFPDPSARSTANEGNQDAVETLPGHGVSRAVRIVLGRF